MLFRIRKETEVGIICSSAISEGDFYLAITYSVGATFIYTMDSKADFASSTVDREENCVDALAFRFFDNLFCGLVGATLPSDEDDAETSFARLYPSSLSGQLLQLHGGGGGRSETIFSSESEQRLLQFSYQASLLIRYDFQDGGDIFAADQPPLSDGEAIFTNIVVPTAQLQQEKRRLKG